MKTFLKIAGVMVITIITATGWLLVATWFDKVLEHHWYQPVVGALMFMFGLVMIPYFQFFIGRIKVK